MIIDDGGVTWLSFLGDLLSQAQNYKTHSSISAIKKKPCTSLIVFLHRGLHKNVLSGQE